MTDAAAGAIEVITTEQGWIRIPHSLDPTERSEWVEDAVDGLREGWGELWSEEVEDRARSMLLASLEDRPDAHLVLEAWPVFRTVRVRVQMSIFESGSLPDWREEGFSVLAYEDAPIGPGIMCVRMHEMPSGDDTEVALVDWAAVFDDGEEALVVMVETTMLTLFVRMLEGLHGLIGTLQVTRPDGSLFVAQPPQLVITDDDAIWHGLQLQASLASDDEAAEDE